ncbi:fimbrial biogenesis outer membrane usher protein [Proteus vulgaris]|uniref:fimbria/pilus outer membrane usher protein n=1 Tax=Proteus TaxID=583 RepID=UPI0018E462F7|nr:MULTISPECIES: fimbria/pilus outer membrane usher protein [Proteus]MBI6543793.1 fimbrial biogenesis outer membrane usher protein [Proteus vulgaris]
MKKIKDNYFNKSPLYLFIAGALFTSFNTSANDYYPANLLNIEGSAQQVTNEDLNVFRENNIAPGHYKVTLFINDNRVLTRDFDFILMEDKEGNPILAPRLSAEEWYKAGVDLPYDVINKNKNNDFINLNEINNANGYLDLNKKQYILTLPQLYVNEDRLKENEIKNWDSGIPALLVNYALSSFNSRSQGNTTDSYYGNIQTQVNLGPWRFNNYSTWTKNENGEKKWNTLSNVLSRAITSINSELMMGDLYTSSQLFDSVKFRGIKLVTDRLMTPTQNRTYAPSVSGIANTESIVTITQNGQVIYKRSVPAGPFNITDYYPMNSGGDLHVSVTEADGSEKNFIVPFSSIANLERKGELKYSFSTGKYDGNNSGDGAYVVQTEAFYGLTDYVTLYGGVLIGEKYQSVGVGTGVNLGSYGAITTDLLYAKSSTNNGNDSLHGNAFRVNYSKNISVTDTTLSLVGYRHFDANFLNFTQAMEYKDSKYHPSNGLKNEYTLSINQPLFSNNASINLNSVIYKYVSGKTVHSYNMGFNSAINKVNYSVYYTYYDGSRYNESNKKNSHDLSMNVSIPFSWNENYIWANYGISTNNDNQVLQTARLSGTYGDKNQANWDVYQGYGNKGVNYSGGLNGSYKTQSAVFNAGYSYTQDKQNINYGISGALVATQYGAVFAPSLQQTNALILTKNTSGVEVINGQSIKTNNSGLAVISGMSPYQKNSISVNTNSIPSDTEISNNIISNIVPTKGALVLADFDAKKGFKFLLTLQTPDKSTIPMGAKAEIDNDDTQLVASFHQLYFVANKPQGNIQVSWTINGEQKTCHAIYDINNKAPVNGLYILDTECK